MSNDPYARITNEPFYKRQFVGGHVVAVLDLKTTGRNLDLIVTRSRVLKRHDIHEIILTDDAYAEPGSKVRDVVYLAFFEVDEGGVVVTGDQLLCGDSVIGELAGYDETHYPNHLNIVVRADAPATGRERGLDVGDEIRFIRR